MCLSIIAFSVYGRFSHLLVQSMPFYVVTFDVSVSNGRQRPRKKWRRFLSLRGSQSRRCSECHSHFAIRTDLPVVFRWTKRLVRFNRQPSSHNFSHISNSSSSINNCSNTRININITNNNDSSNRLTAATKATATTTITVKTVRRTVSTTTKQQL